MTDDLHRTVSSGNDSSHTVPEVAVPVAAVTTLSQSQELTQQILDSSDDCIKVLDLEGRILFMSPGGQALLGIQDITPFLHRPWAEFWKGVDQQAAMEAVARARVGKVSTFQGYRPTLTGEPKWWDNKISSIRGADGQVERLLCISRDITQRQQSEDQRQQAEAQLRKSEAHLSAIFSQAAVGLSEVSLDGRFQRVNDELCRILGRSPEEMLAAGILDITHPEDVPKSWAAIQQLLGTGRPISLDKRYLRPDGSTVWANSSLTRLDDEPGRPHTMLAVTVDLSDRKQVEAALRQSEEQARLAIQVARLGTWRYNLDLKVVELDERTREIWGEPQEAATLPLPRVMARIHPADGERVATAIAAALHPSSSGIYEIDYRILWDDATERWISANGQALFIGEGEFRQPVSFLGTVLDVTEGKQAEERLRKSAERLSIALTAAKLGDWSWSAATDIVTFSEQAAEMFGIPPGPYMNWTQMQSLIHPEDREQARLQAEQAVANRTDYDIEYRVLHSNRSERWIAAKGRAQYDSSGQVLEMLGVVQDITARKQAEVEREQLLVTEQTVREEAERANRVKDEFLAVLSHELRSPLNPILGWARLLQNGKLDAVKTQQALKIIERNAQLQSELIEDLLDVSRILQGKLNLNPSPLNLTSIIQAATETVRLAAEAKVIKLESRLADVGQVFGDATRLQQVIWNLLSNAVKFTPAGGQVSIRLESLDTDAHITVSDTGQGIAPEFLPYVFDYFRQANGTTTRQSGGLGLGLAIVRHLVELHGGTVRVASPGIGMGATFTVTLPMRHIQATVEPTHTSSELSCDLHGIQVLVVDDELDSREFAAFVLEEAGASVLTAATAHEALALLIRAQPDVLLSDIGMPNMDGYMLMQQVRALPPEQGGQVPAIALTAYAGEIDQQQALAAGFQRHMAKPVEPENLVRAIIALMKS
ncbi:PAS domain-containing protein [Trichocoleus sp. FACHB-591]|uniref:PAS domain-containing protein n=1 Tax=Trichocoleus sp. FACHB-591 TaxID=2692872 RepID=UPI0016879986|nr:PAS domain-containing protein [Trichocoleus sp. FACHB-591]MBD2094303.1 PAS domain-containing protein [Trichocoleus sp. FACHB-591]